MNKLNKNCPVPELFKNKELTRAKCPQPEIREGLAH